MTAHAVFLVLAVLAWVSLGIWIVLLLGRGGFWRMNLQLPEAERDDAREWPAVTAVIPARDEARILPSTLPSVLAQDYPGPFTVIVVDDASTDGTGEVATELAAATPDRAEPRVLRGAGPPPGWAGKVAAMDLGVRESDKSSEYLLFTDSDISHPADSLRRLVRHAQDRRLDLVSLMARLSTDSPAERMIVPAFVYSFFQLYPPAWVNRPSSRTAAAAGGCMLVRREALDEVGGLVGIADARIDDVALGTLLKRSGGRVWLGVTTGVRSRRPYPRLADLWDMIARSAYTQLRYSPWLLLGTIVGLVLSYGVPPILGLVGLATHWWGVAIPALAAWAVMSASYIPVLRLYDLRWWRAPLLPGVMALYGAMTVDSARRHRRGRGGSWKGRVIEPGG
ncbi:glycosyltransferase [Actinospica sp.]|uniref:glycosyltransferase n=1 Tax=Actinospica sp. TaxID=1872142 RepID=UPI002CC47340|nr:glycosyltransferase [Actinospica sp.]HWG27177.1 glycosyltransferase [Actinospica sp.]